MSILGRDMSATNEDADHVLDLQFGGIDDHLNMWPLNADVNRSAMRFGDQPVKVQLNGQIMVIPLNDSRLLNKFFIIKGMRIF